MSFIQCEGVLISETGIFGVFEGAGVDGGMLNMLPEKPPDGAWELEF